MKSKKNNYYIIGIAIFCSLISINSLFFSNKEGKKSNLIINYDKKATVEDDKIFDEANGVRITSDNIYTRMKLLPVPDVNDIINLYAL